MKKLLTLIMVLGGLLPPGPVLNPAEAGEVQLTTTLENLVLDAQAQLGMGVREVEVRGLTSQQVNDAFLSTDPTKNDLVKIGNALGEGQRVNIRTTDGERFRIRNEDGQLRILMKDVRLDTVDPQALATTLSGFDRVEIRGIDAAGNRVRLEMRDGVVKKNEVKPDWGGQEPPRPLIIDAGTRTLVRELERMQRVEKPRHVEKMEKIERPERSGGRRH